LGVEFWLRPDPAAGLWAFPIETVSVSEAGFERVYQGSAVLLHWPVAGDADRAVHVEVRHR
jgi:alpha-amylase